ncbi:hypothetical protein [Aeromonas sp. Y318-3]|uniref:hypothetical protein n=1 Tax=Aeromonas sp. Y318-3 TaxID=2990509 RepID=UPI0022DF2540|nr:hypothetical protein [Aeromonas sp. Y318-3]
MIHYHGGPITPDTCAIKAWKGRHAFISYANPKQLTLASEITQSFALDNGAFTFWRTGTPIDWSGYYDFVRRWMNHPRFDFAIIPDVIDGGESGNDALLEAWPLGSVGVPVWHMNESDERFIRLCRNYDRVAIGSCGEYDVKHPKKCVAKLKDVIRHVVTEDGFPIAKLHMLRGLNKSVFQHLPFASADSTNVARNIGLDSAWKGTYQPQSKETRASILVERVESCVSASRLVYDRESDKIDIQLALEI